jgi:hypothetical protein
MLLTKKVKIKVNSSNRKSMNLSTIYFIGEEIEVKVKQLSKNSHVKVLCQCDNCGSQKEMKYQTYNKINQNNKYYCSKKECINIKRQKSLNEKYGCDNVFQLNSVKEKSKVTCLEKFGCENPHQNEEVKKKAEKTNIERYDCINPFQNEGCKEKSRKTCLENYGVEYAQQSIKLREKTKKTNNKNYGTDYPNQNREFFDNVSIKSLIRKRYRDTDLHYQGSYELDFLDKYYDSIKIENGKTIKYIYEEEQTFYFSDFYLPEYNLVIEVKSSYWFNIHKKRCIAKAEETKKYYNYLMILDKNYSEFEFITSK